MADSLIWGAGSPRISGHYGTTQRDSEVAVSKTKETPGQPVGEESLSRHFDLAKRIRRGISECACEHSNNGKENATYLWVCVSKAGLGTGQQGRHTSPLSMDEWLNVIDEAASVGVSRLVLSAKGSFSDYPPMWKLCEWAQGTHGMVVVLHTNAETLSDEEVAAIRALDMSLTRLMLTETAVEAAQPLTQAGMTTCCVDHGPLEENPCDRPGKMVFVNPEGVLYTCGLVEGLDDYHMGDVFDGKLIKILRDPDLPREVADQDRFFEQAHNCDGCPALAQELFKEGQA